MKIATALLVAALATPAARAAVVLPFIEDDFAKATSLAKSKNVPIFVEAWAPW